ncbi:phosphate ABC transporter substrate-binding protein PstS [Aeromicrobium piscarium]|uniref:Phosphate-binding protein n=1 Tax=Aeromicrobium piscarium TaxID=2590901 RepID=A0A554SPF6_9ACTN|nr:phosphate ABC transporter substrate-binding protein PstS [Aeromicrobium piscarium]TSD68208.1 phosphate ABC transporter substrate-binding protein PstS [Aeromicrobium piscarium]
MSKSMRKAAALGAGAVLAFGLTACGAGNETGDGGESSSSDLSGTLNGAGASSQQAAVSAWQQGFQTENSDVTVNYDPIGSGGGREQFLDGGTDFAGSDAYLDDDELTKANDLCGQIVSVPTYVSPIAVIYNLPGVEDLQLSPSTIGSIFAGEITTWNDPAIAEDNPDADLPDSAITPVHRSDDSGTTENFTEYLDAASEGTWTAGVVETWPTQGGEAANGTSGVVAAVESGEGTIGYADASQAGELGQVAVKVGEEYVGPTEEAAARVLDTAEQVEGREDTDIALELDRATTEAGVYPIVLVSYQMACQTYDDAEKAELVKSWLTYVVSEDGQQAAADSAGSAPLTDDFREKVQTAIDTIGS